MKYFKSIIFVLLLSACSQNSGHENHQNNESKVHKALFEEVMKVHDEVMPKQNLLAKYRDTLTQEIERISVKSGTDTVLLAEKKAIHKDLDYAYKAMNMWMQNFDADYDKKSETEQKTYLEQEKKTISVVAQKMNESIEKAKNRRK